MDTRALTGIRGIAAIAVMIFHYLDGWPALGLARHAVSKGYLAVDLFFILSGYVVMMNNGAAFSGAATPRACGAFYLRRVARIYPAFFAVTLLTIAYQTMTGTYGTSSGTLLANALMAHQWFGLDGVVGVSWSVSAEVFAYLAFPMIAGFVLRRNSWVALALMLIALAGLWRISCLSSATPAQVERNGPLDIYGSGPLPLLVGLCGFVAGLCTHRLSGTCAGRTLMTAKGLPEALLAAIAGLAWFTDLDALIAALFVPLILGLTHPDHAAARLLRSQAMLRLGELSYAIYLTHCLVFAAVLRTAPALPFPVAAVCAAGLTFVAAALLHAAIEKPCHMLIKRGLPRPTPAAPTDAALAA